MPDCHWNRFVLTDRHVVGRHSKRAEESALTSLAAFCSLTSTDLWTPLDRYVFHLALYLLTVQCDCDISVRTKIAWWCPYYDSLAVKLMIENIHLKSKPSRLEVKVLAPNNICWTYQKPVVSWLQTFVLSTRSNVSSSLNKTNKQKSNKTSEFSNISIEKPQYIAENSILLFSYGLTTFRPWCSTLVSPDFEGSFNWTTGNIPLMSYNLTSVLRRKSCKRKSVVTGAFLEFEWYSRLVSFLFPYIWLLHPVNHSDD